MMHGQVPAPVLVAQAVKVRCAGRPRAGVLK